MKKLLSIITVAVIFSSCTLKTGSGNIDTEQRDVKNFKGVTAGGSFDVKLRQGNTFKVRVEADDNILEDIETEVRGDKLRIQFRSGVSLNNITAKVYVEAPEFTFIGGSASATIESEGTLKSDSKIEVDASSAANMNLTVDAPDVEAEASSGSTLNLKGLTKNIDLQSSSGAHLNAGELLAENAKAQASSGSVINLHASVKLNAQVSSGASVDYKGNATVSKQESSGGSISKKD